MNKPKISVIVPVFNIEKRLLSKCIESLLSQTFSEIEIILIDDASNNQETIETLFYYKKNNESITLVTHKQNKKQGGARNTGLKIAKGEYIAFVDADDYVDKDMYRLLYKQAIEENADIVDCDLIHVNKDYNHIKKEISITNSHLTIGNYGRNVSKIFKKQLILNNKIYFPENMFYEDNAIMGLHILYAKKISKVNQYLYYYVRHSNSTVSNASLHIDDKIKAGQIFYNTMNERGFLDKYKEELLVKYFEIYFKITYRLIMKYDKDYYSKLSNIITDMQKNGLNLSSSSIQNTLKGKEKFELWLLTKMPKLFIFYVNIKYQKYKGKK